MSISSTGIARYAVPTPEGQDGESVTLCDDCLHEHPQAKELEWLNDKRDPHDCAGPKGDHSEDCPNIPDEDEEDSDDPEDDEEGLDA